MKRALITGITGQDGSYLAEFLLEQGYEVWGIIRRSASFNTGRLQDIYEDPHVEGVSLHLRYGDVCDTNSVVSIVDEARPDEVYNLAAQSHVRVSFDIPEYTSDAAALGTLRVLEAIHRLKLTECRFYQAGSSEMYGKVLETPQTETTPFYPRSAYAAAKVYAHCITRTYREAYDLFACNGILFNHESPRRGRTFVTRKIACAAAAIAEGKQDRLFLGNLDARRDWGYAPEYVQAMWKMLQQARPDDYVIATGETHSVREFCEIAFARCGMTLNWVGEGVSEQGLVDNDRVVVEIDPRYFRPAEVDLLMGSAEKANAQLGWQATTGFRTLVETMVDAELKAIKSGASHDG